MSRTIKVVAALAIGTLTLTACGNTTEGEGANAAESEITAPDASEVCTEEHVGGEITIGEYTMLPTFAPGQGNTGNYGGAQSAAVFDRLMRWDPETEEFVPQLASSLESNDDHTEWTLSLPEGVQFSNGEELTADDVAFTLGVHQDTETRSMAMSDALNVESVEVEDPLTVRYTLAQPWAGFPLLLSGAAGEVLPQETYESTDPEEWARNPVGAGAFTLESYIPDQEAVLVPNPDYHGGVVCPTLRFNRIAGAQGTLDALETGEFQAGFLRGARYVDDAANQGFSGYLDTISAGSVVAMNAGTGGYDGILTDERVRRAVAHAIDRDLYDDRTTGGVGRPSAEMIGESSRFYTGAEGLDYDPKLATQLLDEARADHPDWDGSLSILLGDGPENHEAGIVVQSMLNAVGFDVATESVPMSQNVARTLSGDFEITTSGIPLSDADPTAQLYANLTPEGVANRTGVDDPELTAAVTAAQAAPDDEAKAEALAELQEIVNRVSPVAVLAESEEFVAIDESLSGVLPTLNSVMLYDQAFVRR